MDRAKFDHFYAAQDPLLEDVHAELLAGQKRSHWMWFIFPQLAGLGASPMALRYGLQDGVEARHYLDDPVLGSRLRQHTELMLRHVGKTAVEILGSPDDLKFRSCVTLFHKVATDEADRRLFDRALQAFYAGYPDERTLAMLER